MKIEIKKQLLERYYIHDKLSANAISKLLDVDVKTILRRMSEHNIKLRDISEERRLNRLREGNWVGEKNPMKDIKLREKALKNRPSFAGENNPRYGIKLSDETKDKIRQKHIGKKLSELHKANIRNKTPRLEKSPHWKGGVSFQPYSFQWTEELKTSIRQRDKFVCQICGENGFCVHHIDYNKKNCNPNNLITLCRLCHSKTNKNREYWQKFFSR